MLVPDIGGFCNTASHTLDIGESCKSARVMILPDIDESCITARVIVLADMLLADIGESCNRHR